MEKENLNTEDARPIFCKIIFGDDVKLHLRIPPAFMKHLPQEMPNRATLTGPSGGHWGVTVSTDENGTYLQKGWKEFMKENNLGDNEFLMFRYDGNMQFYVKIFNKSGVKREAAPVSVSGYSNGKRARGRPWKRSIGSKSLHKQQLHGSEEHPGQSSRIRKTVNPFTSKSPHFMTSLIKYNVEKNFILRIPRSFSNAANFTPSKKKVVLRDSAGKGWDVICLHDKGGHCLSGGWGPFVHYNKLKLGDVCIFELVSIDEMQVHVL